MEKGVRSREMVRSALSRTALLFFVLAFLLLSPFSLLLTPAHAYTSPGSPRGFVSDFAEIIPSAEEAAISAKLQSLEQVTGAQVAVVTIKSLDGETIETYAVRLFEEWGIGQAKDDNGLLLLVAPDEREVRVEVGYGLEGTVTDLQSGNIIRSVILPAFREENYAAGIDGAVDALSAIITNSPEAAQYSMPDSSSSSIGSIFDGVDPFVFVFFGIFLLNIFARILGKSKSWWLGGVIGAAIGVVIGFIIGSMIGGIISSVVLAILGLIFDYIVSKRPPGSKGGHGGFWPIFFGGSGGHGSSGFGGFGGGMSGGGGASGRW
jgi:uncharacterized protein